jgi:hypothetical protein
MKSRKYGRGDNECIQSFGDQPFWKTLTSETVTDGWTILSWSFRLLALRMGDLISAGSTEFPVLISAILNLRFCSRRVS